MAAKAGPRVLFVNRVGFLGGSERVLLTMATGIVRLGYVPIIVCPGGGALEADAKSKRYRC